MKEWDKFFITVKDSGIEDIENAYKIELTYRTLVRIQFSSLSYPNRKVEPEENTVEAVYMKRTPIFGKKSPHNGQKTNSITAKIEKIQELSVEERCFLAAYDKINKTF